MVLVSGRGMLDKPAALSVRKCGGGAAVRMDEVAGRTEMEERTTIVAPTETDEAQGARARTGRPSAVLLAVIALWAGPTLLLPAMPATGMRTIMAHAARAAEIPRPPEDDVEDDVESDVEDRVEEQVRDRVEDRVQERVEDRVEDRVQERIEDRMENAVEDEVEDGVETRVESDAEDRIHEDLAGRIDDVRDGKTGGDADDDADDAGAWGGDGERREGRHGADDDEEGEQGREDARGRERRTGTADDTRSEIAVMRGLDGRDEAAVADELLVMVPRALAARLRSDIAEDRAVARVTGTDLALLDRTLLRVRTRPGAAIAELRARIAARLPGDGRVDLNHVYRPQQAAPARTVGTAREGARESARRAGTADAPPAEAATGAAGGSPASSGAVAGLPPAAFATMLGLPPAGASGPTRIRIGIVDSAAWRAHPCLRGRDFTERRFVPRGVPVARTHATMMLSILIARPECGIRGLVENADISLAAVFFESPDYGTLTTADALVSALDWLIGRRVRVVVLALAGPPNRLLEAAVKAAAARGTVLIAAAGNGGPQAPPAYPAAWRETLAITAVDRRGRVYAHAGRGPHIDFAAPGVDIRVAVPGRDVGLRPASGTSLACAFAGAAIAWWLAEDETGLRKRPARVVPTTGGGTERDRLIAMLRNAAIDLPPLGRDPASGHGLLHIPDGHGPARAR